MEKEKDTMYGDVQYCRYVDGESGIIGIIRVYLSIRTCILQVARYQGRKEKKRLKSNIMEYIKSIPAVHYVWCMPTLPKLLSSSYIPKVNR